MITSAEIWQLVTIAIGLVATFVGWAFKNALKNIVDRLKAVEEHQQKNHEILHSDFVRKDEHHAYIGKMEGLFSTVFRDVKELSKSLHQTIGQLNLVRELKKHD